MSEMGSEDDPQIKAAQDLLQSRLEDILSNSSADCRTKLAEFQYIPVADPAGDPLIRAAIRDLIERSLEHISEGFKSLLGLTRESQNNGGNSRADIAKILTWEAIDQTFQWTTGDKGNARRFREWQTLAIGLEFVRADELLTVPPECTLKNANLFEFLHWDFVRRFERLLTQRRNETFLNNFSTQSTKAAASSDSAAPAVAFVHTDDYRAIVVKGKKYKLTPNQALIVKALHDAHVNRFPAVSQATLLRSINSPDSRIRDSFRSGDGLKLWKNLIRRVRRGMYALRLPTD